MSGTNKVTLRGIDNVLLGGALYGVSKVVGELAGAAGERALTHGMNHATGLLVGYGTDWQRALLVTSKHRPTRRGDVVGTTDHPANVIIVGEELAVYTRDDGFAYGIVEACNDEGIQLSDDWNALEWDDIVRIEAMGGKVWSCYDGDQRWDYEISQHGVGRLR